MTGTERSSTSLRNPVGLIGVGLMGAAFAHRLRQAGLPVLGFDVDRARLARLAEIGGKVADSARPVARRWSHILIVVFSSDQAEGATSEIGAGLADGRG